MSRRQMSSMWRYFWSAHQRFFRQLCVAAKVPAVVRIASAAVQEGKCVVIGLQSTGEAALERAGWNVEAAMGVLLG